jgi:hypothetical protein
MKSRLLDFERIRFLRLLFEGYLEFRELYYQFDKEGAIPRARIIERLRREVFQELKEHAHALFRPSETATPPEWRDHEHLCDLVVGACFHEILQLQENLYLVKLYRPRYADLESKAMDTSLAEYFKVGASVISEAEAQIPKNLQWIWQLLQEALGLVKTLLPAYRGNRILTRFLTQQLTLLEKVYGEGDLREFFSRLYPGGLEEALWENARDLVNSAHHHTALDSISCLLLREKSEDSIHRVERDRLSEALHSILASARRERDLDLINRCEHLMTQAGLPG